MTTLEDIVRFNPWWTTGKVREELLQRYRRSLYNRLKENLARRQILLLWGIRRVGKTVLVYQLIDDLLKDGLPPKRILYFSFDEIPSDIKDVLEYYQKFILGTTFESLKERIYIFFDEIQKVNDWENKVKTYYDLYPQLKFILTGSASVALRKRSGESLAGRIMSFLLEPLSFREFLELSGKDVQTILVNPRLWDREVAPLFYRYLKYGTFHELVTESDERFVKEYMLNNVVERVVYKDLPREFGLADVELLKTLFYLIAKNPGLIVNYSELSKNLGRDKRTIANYFEYLEYGLLIRFVYNYRGSPLASARKLKKAYLGTPNLAFVASDDFYGMLPKLLENLVLLKTDARFFYRNSFEVDFVIEDEEGLTGIEVKKGESSLRQLKSFERHFGKKVKRTILVSMERSEEETENSIVAWEFSLSFGDAD